MLWNFLLCIFQTKIYSCSKKFIFFRILHLIFRNFVKFILISSLCQLNHYNNLFSIFVILFRLILFFLLSQHDTKFHHFLLSVPFQTILSFNLSNLFEFLFWRWFISVIWWVDPYFLLFLHLAKIFHHNMTIFVSVFQKQGSIIAPDVELFLIIHKFSHFSF